jgi:peptide/nickel transport system substrate-binding protein
MKLRILFLIVIVALVAGCSSEQQSDDRSVFRYNESNGITSLDPAFARNLENMWAVNQLFDGLVELDSALRIQPLIARSWEVTDSGTTYIFNLRTDVCFHPSPLFADSLNRKVTAHDFVYSFSRILDPSTASPGKWIFDNLRSAKNGGMEARDDSTLILRLERAFPPFLGMLTTQYANVVPREVVEHYGQDFRSHPIGTGPFRFAFWLEDVALVFHKNEHFWQRDAAGRALPYLDAVKISFVRDMSAEFLGLLQGQFDMMSGLHPAYKDELLTEDGALRDNFKDRIRFQKTPFIKTDYIGILVDPELPQVQAHPLSDKRVRRALNFAIDRRSMVRYLRNNSVFEATGGFIPQGLPAYDPNASYGLRYDTEYARALLAEAGYGGGEGIPTLELSTTSDYVDLCEFLQHQWAQIGIETEIEVLPGAAHREKVAKSQAMLFRKSWLADYADAVNFLTLFNSANFCPKGPNYTHFKNTTFDSLYAAAAQLPNLEDRIPLYRRMDSLVMEESPVIPLFYDQVSHFIRNEVKAFETNGVNMLNLKQTRVQDR